MWTRPFEPLLPLSWACRGPALVVAPHQDDEVIGCGALIAAHRDQGEAVTVVYGTDGASSDPSGEGGEAWKQRRKDEARAATESLGGCELRFLDHPDGELGAALTAVAEIANVLEERGTKTLLCPSPFEIHPDHRAACLHGVAAALRSEGPVERVLFYEVGAAMPANLLLEATAYLPRKEAALAHHRSQIANMPDLVEKMRAVARARCVNVPLPDVRYAEAYLECGTDGLEELLERSESLLRFVAARTPHP